MKSTQVDVMDQGVGRDRICEPGVVGLSVLGPVAFVVVKDQKPFCVLFNLIFFKTTVISKY